MRRRLATLCALALVILAVFLCSRALRRAKGSPGRAQGRSAADSLVNAAAARTEASDPTTRAAARAMNQPAPTPAVPRAGQGGDEELDPAPMPEVDEKKKALQAIRGDYTESKGSLEDGAPDEHVANYLRSLLDGSFILPGDSRTRVDDRAEHLWSFPASRLRTMNEPLQRELEREILGYYERETNPMARAALLRMLDVLPTSLDTVTEALRATDPSNDPFLRGTGVQVLAHHNAAPGVLDDLVRVFQSDPEEIIRETAFNAMPSPSREPRVGRLDQDWLFSSPDHSIRSRIAAGMGFSTDPATVDLLQRAYRQDESCEVKLTCLESLLRRAPDTGRRLIEEAINSSSDPWLRASAKDWLDRWDAGKVAR